MSFILDPSPRGTFAAAIAKPDSDPRFFEKELFNEDSNSPVSERRGRRKCDVSIGKAPIGSITRWFINVRTPQFLPDEMGGWERQIQLIAFFRPHWYWITNCWRSSWLFGPTPLAPNLANGKNPRNGHKSRWRVRDTYYGPLA